MDKTTTLLVPVTDRGGSGKTVSLMLCADHLKVKGKKVAIIDADNGNWNKPGGIGNFFKKGVIQLDIRRQRDLDSILEMTAEFDGYVLADLPANSKASTERWFEEVATVETLTDMGIRLVCIVPVAQQVAGATESALDYLSLIGPRGTFIVALNRIQAELAPRPLSEAFKEWHSVDVSEYDNHTIEIPNLDPVSMEDLVKGRSLPSDLNGEIRYLSKRRITTWKNQVHAQLEEAGL